MSDVIYDNVIRTETLNRGERTEMMVDIYESSETVRNHEVMINTERQQELQHTGSVSVKNRRHKVVQVCLWLLCVLLLTAVIVLFVYFTFDRNRFLTHYHNLAKEREKILTEYPEILNQNRNLTEEREQIKNKTDELHECLTRHWINGDPNTYYVICAVTSTSGWIHYSCDSISRWICEKRF